MLVREGLHSAPVTVPPSCSIAEAAQLMGRHGVGALLVVSAGRLLGIVTDRDLAVHGIGAGKSPQDPVSGVMTADPVTIQGAEDISSAFTAFQGARGRRLPVLEDDEVAGVISLDDLLIALVIEFNAAIAPIAREIVAPELSG